jgi:ADP-heptose:LPS heptosyltransferase
VPSADELSGEFGISPVHELRESIRSLLTTDKFNIVLHPGSRGSAQSWPLQHYAALMRNLGACGCRVFLTGSQSEKILLSDWVASLDIPVVNLMGELDLGELIAFLASIDGFVACSTGPLHISAALGRRVLGLYSSQRPIHPGRWRPLGSCARYIESWNVSDISPEQVLAVIARWRQESGCMQ